MKKGTTVKVLHCDYFDDKCGDVGEVMGIDPINSNSISVFIPRLRRSYCYKTDGLKVIGKITKPKNLPLDMAKITEDAEEWLGISKKFVDILRASLKNEED